MQATGEYFEKALSIGRAIGNRRQEVIALHNLANNYIDQGNWEEARRCEEQYLAISRVTGNRLAESYAPNALGDIAVYQGDYDQAETLIRQSLQIAEENNWLVMVEVNRISLGQLQLHRWLDQRDAVSLERAYRELRAVEEAPHQEQGGEFYAYLALALFLAGNHEEAGTVIRRARQRADESWVVDRVWLDFAEAAVNRQPWDAPLGWFREHGFRRVEVFISRLKAVLQP